MGGYRCADAVVGVTALAAAVAGPLGAMWLPAARTPAVSMAAVASFIRRGVIQFGLWVASQVRIPVAAAPAVIADAMHCMHMMARLARRNLRAAGWL